LYLLNLLISHIIHSAHEVFAGIPYLTVHKCLSAIHLRAVSVTVMGLGGSSGTFTVLDWDDREEVLNYFKTGRKLNGALKFWGILVTWEELVVITV